MAERHGTGARLRPFEQIGLRARITLAFACGAALVSGALIVISVVLSRNTLLDRREDTATTRARINAVAVTDKVGLPDTDAQALFGSLATSGRPSVILRDSGKERSISFDTRYGADAVPRALVRSVLDGRTAGVQRFDLRGEPVVAVGVPLTDRDGGYFEITSLRDISDATTSLTRVLLVAALVAAVAGAGLGWWASRRVLRPLADISHVAEDIAAGKLDARLAYSEWADDVDLAPLVSSFNEMVAALQARIDRDARFASDVSHELRSPLTTFNASIEVLQNGREEMSDRARTALDLLSSDMERFTQLVEDLLEISRFDAGAVRLELDEVLLADTVAIAVRTLSPTPIPVEIDDRLTDVVMLCDKRRLVRVLANFIDNAAKYGDGAVRVTLDRIDGEPHEDDPEGAPVLDHVRIGVEDAGSGVPEAERERIFDRFNRGDQGGSRGNDLGVGLGLALAAEHARLQGGSVWVENRPDGEHGARFVIELPLILPDDDETEEDEPAHALDEVITTGEHRALSLADIAELSGEG